MRAQSVKQLLRVWMLPIAMAGGIIFHNHIALLSPFSPYLIGIMLFLTYCKLNPKEMRVSYFSLCLLSVQILLSIILYFILSPYNDLLAQGLFICIFCPTATAAPVITGMLGGSVSKLAAFSIVSNMAVAILAPFLFSLMGHHGHGTDLSFFTITGLISLKVIPLILGPLVLALLIEFISPAVHDKIGQYQNISFYVWALSLFIVVGNAVSYVLNHLQQNSDESISMIQLAIISLIACLFQFYIGRRIGNKYGDKIAGAQGLGQKNTVLAIWMSLTFLNPLSSIAPAAYVAWQNTINSLQIWYKSRSQLKNI